MDFPLFAQSIIALMLVPFLMGQLVSASDFTGSHLKEIVHQTGICCTVITEIPQDECDALAAIYQSMHGVQSYLDWFTSNTPCSWLAVTCDAGHIIELSFCYDILCNSGLSGDLPPEMHKLSHLTTLDMVGAQVTNIPSKIGELKALAANSYTNPNELWSDWSNETITTLPAASIDENTGSVGSYFQLTANGFPENAALEVLINNRSLAVLNANASGEITFSISTTNADEGGYLVTLISNIDDTITLVTYSFSLYANLPQNPQTIDNPVVEVPAGLAHTIVAFLPLAPN